MINYFKTLKMNELILANNDVFLFWFQIIKVVEEHRSWTRVGVCKRQVDGEFLMDGGNWI